MYEIVVGRDEEDRKVYGTDGTFLIGKHYVKMGQTTSLSNEILMDVARSHVVLVCGKRGSGKCVAGDTLIALEDGRLTPIKDLEYDSSGIVALGEDLKTRAVPKSAFYKRTVKELLEITTRSGKTIKLTPEHPLLSIYGWTNAAAFSVGDRIASPRKIPNFGREAIPLPQVKLLAYLIAEGHLVQGVHFSNTDPVLVKDFSEAARQFNEDIEVVKTGENDYRLYTRNFKSSIESKQTGRNSLGQFVNGALRSKTPLRKFLEAQSLYKKLSAGKRIPEQVMQLQKPLLSAFLRILFSCDGSIYKKKAGNAACWQISYSTASPEMAVQLQHLLLRYSILSKLRHRKVKCKGRLFDSCELVASGENVLSFVEQIGFFGRKEGIQHKALKEMFFIKRNPNTDTIPKGIWRLYKPQNWAKIGRDLGYSHPKAMRERIHYCPSRNTLLQVAVSEQNEFLHTLATSDIFWDEITAINKLTGIFEVFDLTVPGLHNFVANDLIVHNSYTMGIIAEGMMSLPPEISQNLSVIILDTMGIYWTMKYDNMKDEGLLKEWGLKPQGLNVQIYTPIGYYQQFKDKGIPTDFPFSVRTSEIDGPEWCALFEMSLASQVGVLIERTINEIRETKQSYSIKDIINLLNKDKGSEPHEAAAAVNRFLAADTWGLFSETGMTFRDLVTGGKISILDVSCYSTLPGAEHIRALVIGLVSKKLFIERMGARRMEEYEDVKATLSYTEKEAKKQMPLVWIMVDEAHEFLPRVGTTLASSGLITLLREGRQPGISLILATQQPGKIHTDVMTQSDIVISHRLTAQIDVEALGMLMQSYMREGLDKYLNELPRVKGAAIIFDDTNERIYPMRIRPRITWHGGSAPSPIQIKKKLFSY